MMSARFVNKKITLRERDETAISCNKIIEKRIVCGEAGDIGSFNIKSFLLKGTEGTAGQGLDHYHI